LTATHVSIEDLRAVIATVLETEPDDVTDDVSFTEELQIDSLLLLEIYSQVETRYGVAIDDVLQADIQSLKELHAFVSAKLDGGRTA
jgi:acyl carrier protein